MVLVVRSYIHYIYIERDKHISMREEIQIAPPNLSKGDSLSFPIKTHLLQIFFPGSSKKNQLKPESLSKQLKA